MDYNKNDKAVSTIVGFVLLLAILIVSFSLVQERIPTIAEEDEFEFTENVIVNDLKQLEDVKKTSLTLESNERTVFDTNVRYSLLVNTQSSILRVNDNTMNIDSEQKDISIVYQNSEEDTVFIDETTESLNIRYDFIYSDSVEFKKQHTYLLREEPNIITENPILILDDQNKIIIRSVEYNFNLGLDVDTFDLDGETKSENITSIEPFTYSIETSTPVEEFYFLEEKNNVLYVERDGEDVVITLQSGTYEVVTEEINVNVID